MDEMYRMLGREHEADLEREALKWRRAAEVGERQGVDAAAPQNDRRSVCRSFSHESRHSWAAQLAPRRRCGRSNWLRRTSASERWRERRRWQCSAQFSRPSASSR